MSGTTIGGIKAAKKNRKLYGKDYYQRIGSMGGKIGRVGGFNNPEVASRAGRIGGLKSTRKGVKNKSSFFTEEEIETIRKHSKKRRWLNI